MKKELRVWLGAILLCLGTATFAHANLIVNGGFEDNYTQLWDVKQSITGWTSISGPGLELHRGPGGEWSHGGAQHVELDSHDYTNTGISTNSAMQQNVATTSGQQYKLDFYYSPRPNVNSLSNTIEVLWNGTLLGSMTADGGVNTSWSLKSYTVTGTGGSDALVFQAAGTDDTLGGYIDDVSLNAVPVPPAFWLLGSGLIAGLVGLRRRKE